MAQCLCTSKSQQISNVKLSLLIVTRRRCIVPLRMVVMQRYAPISRLPSNTHHFRTHVFVTHASTSYDTCREMLLTASQVRGFQYCNDMSHPPPTVEVYFFTGSRSHVDIHCSHRRESLPVVQEIPWSHECRQATTPRALTVHEEHLLVRETCINGPGPRIHGHWRLLTNYVSSFHIHHQHRKAKPYLDISPTPTSVPDQPPQNNDRGRQRDHHPDNGHDGLDREVRHVS